ncbi:MAG: insulinase family protein [Acidobacteriota bacterium]|nr:insulinase family protein [Acidobacteriota bacterium]
MSRRQILGIDRWGSLPVLAILLSAACSGSLSTPPPTAGTTAARQEGATSKSRPDADETAGQDELGASRPEVVALPSPGSPLVAVRLMFAAGSIYDPQGKEGLAALTGLMLAKAGTTGRSYSDLLESLYPMAVSIDVTTDRETTTISAEVHSETLTGFTALLTEALLRPAFAESDFRRNKQQLEAFLLSTLRASNDELLGLEALEQMIFRDHPYGHAPAGTLAGLAAITIEDVRAFSESRFGRNSLTIGVAGGYPEKFPEGLAKTLSALPPGNGELAPLPIPATITGRHFTILEKPTRSVGIHFGYPLPINRSHADYYALMVANSFLGEHRTSHGRLMQQLREKRGLNYGDYSYIEYWHVPPFTNHPSPNVPRRQQFFSVWIRPVVPSTAHFALRNALYEVDRLITHGMSEEEFELTRSFLVNYSKLWAQTLADRLGFLMDSRFYGMDYYIDEVEERLSELTVDDVNRAVRKYLHSDNFEAVIVADDAADIAEYLESEVPSPMVYNSEPGPGIREADAVIERIPVRPAGISTLPVAEIFESAN